MKPVELNQEAHAAMKLEMENQLALLPHQLGIDRLITGCEVIDLDPYTVGAFPRYIKVALRGEYHVDATYRGGIGGLAVGNEVTVIHLRDGGRYEVYGPSGSAGVIVPPSEPGMWLDVRIAAGVPYMDFEPDLPAVVTATGVVTEYATIVAALAAAVATNSVVIPPGTYDETFTLVNGVDVVELFPGTVTINCTTANTAVTTVSGGYIKVKEILVTRSNNNIQAVLASHAAGECTVIAELIRAVNGGTGRAIGVYQTGAGTLYAYAHEFEGSGGDAQTTGVSCDAGIQYIFAKHWCLAESGTGSFSQGALCDGGTQYVRGECRAIDDDACVGAFAAGAGTQTVWGECYGITAAVASSGYGASVMNTSTVQTIIGRCRGEAVDDAVGARNFQGAQTVYGDCDAVATDPAATSYGAYNRITTQTVWGNCTATGGTSSIGAYNRTWAGTPVQRVNGDVTGDHYGARCEVGTQTITNGIATGATFDLIQTGGTMQVFDIAHNTVNGTITWLDGTALESFRDYVRGGLIRCGAVDYELLPVGAAGEILVTDGVDVFWSSTTGITVCNVTMGDDCWIGLGAAAGRIIFDSTPAPNVVAFMACDIGFGILAPQECIHLYSATATRRMEIETGDAGSIAALKLTTPAGSYAWNAYGAANACALYDFTSRTDRIYVNASGYVGISTSNPDRLLHPEASDAVTAAITYAERLSHTTSGTAAPLFGVGQEHELEDAGGARQVASEITTLWATATAGAESPLYRGTTYPAGVAGPGFWGFWTYTAIAGAAITIVPNGAGDVMSGVTIMYQLTESGGGTDGNVVMVLNGGSVDLYDDGVDVLTLTVNADGSVTVVRTAGATTFDLSLLMCWL